MEHDPTPTDHAVVEPGSSVRIHPSRRGFAWKSILLVVGGLSLSAVLLFAVLIAYTYVVVRPDAMAFANDSIRGTFQSWDVTEYSNRASPELLQAAPPATVAELFKKLSNPLGIMQEYQGIQSSNVNSQLLGTPDATAWFVAGAKYEKGPATIRIEAIHRNNRWQLTSFDINSPSLSIQ